MTDSPRRLHAVRQARAFPRGTPLLQAARELGVDIDSVCGGRALCGRCQITLSEGEFAKHGISSRPDHVSPPSPTEERYRARNRRMLPDRRLSCQTQLLGDVVIDVPPDSQVHKQVVRKRAEVRAIELDPVVRLHYVEVEQPDMQAPSGDLQRLQQALAEQWGLGELTCDLRSLQSLQKALRQGHWQVTVAVHSGNRIIAVWPGFHDRAYGLAIDVGSTTIAAHLCDLASGEVLASSGLMNPQIRFGEDLMSRVSYVMMNPGGEVLMTRAVRQAIGVLVEQVAAEARVDAARHPRADLRRQSDHAPSAARDRSDRARRRAVRARHRRGDDALGKRARPPGGASQRAGLRAAVHRRPRRRRYRRRDPVRDAAPRGRPHADRGHRHQCRDRARQPPASARGVVADRPGVRGRADQLRPARGPGRDRARAHRSAPPSSRASR